MRKNKSIIIILLVLSILFINIQPVFASLEFEELKVEEISDNRSSYNSKEEKAISAVEKYEKEGRGFLNANVTIAKTRVNSLEDGKLKSELINRIDYKWNLEETYLALEVLEKRKDKGSLEKFKDALDSVSYDMYPEEKLELQELYYEYLKEINPELEAETGNEEKNKKLDELKIIINRYLDLDLNDMKIEEIQKILDQYEDIKKLYDDIFIEDIDILLEIKTNLEIINVLNEELEIILEKNLSLDNKDKLNSLKREYDDLEEKYKELVNKDLVDSLIDNINKLEELELIAIEADNFNESVQNILNKKSETSDLKLVENIEVSYSELSQLHHEFINQKNYSKMLNYKLELKLAFEALEKLEYYEKSGRGKANINVTRAKIALRRLDDKLVIKNEISKRIDYKWDLEEAKIQVETANNTKKQADVSKARYLISNLDEEDRIILEEILDSLEEDLIEDDRLKNAMDKVDYYEKNGRGKANINVNRAKIAVNKLPDYYEDKLSLRNRIDWKWNLEEAQIVFERASKTKKLRDIEVAEKVISEIDSSYIEEKNFLTQKIETLRSEVESAEHNRLLKEASEYLDKAEEKDSLVFLIIADRKIDLLEDGEDKFNLENRLEILRLQIRNKYFGPIDDALSNIKDETLPIIESGNKIKENIEKLIQMTTKKNKLGFITSVNKVSDIKIYYEEDIFDTWEDSKSSSINVENIDYTTYEDNISLLFKNIEFMKTDVSQRNFDLALSKAEKMTNQLVSLDILLEGLKLDKNLMSLINNKRDSLENIKSILDRKLLLDKTKEKKVTEELLVFEESLEDLSKILKNSSFIKFKFKDYGEYKAIVRGVNGVREEITLEAKAPSKIDSIKSIKEALNTIQDILKEIKNIKNKLINPKERSIFIDEEILELDNLETSLLELQETLLEELSKIDK